MHYGHPDVFDRIFHFTRGGISKASRVINISEDIYAGKSSKVCTFVMYFFTASTSEDIHKNLYVQDIIPVLALFK